MAGSYIALPSDLERFLEAHMAARQAAAPPDRPVFESIQVFHIPGAFGKDNAHTYTVPGVTSGKELFDWYLGFFSALSTMGTLGAGFTLSVVVQSPPKPNAVAFSPDTVVTWAAISSVCFVLTVLVCQGCTQLFKFEHKTIVRGIDHDNHAIKHSLAALSLLLELQVLAAFLFLELVLTAHAPVVGWVGIAITSVLALLALYLWVLQATRQWPVTR